jgi:gentisate 1,2-dioxygenase
MACFATLLQPKQHTRAHRHTGGTVYHVIQGRGSSVINGTRFDWGPKDTFVVPSWHVHEHVAEDECVLFSYNDTPVLHALSLYREEDLGTWQEVSSVFSASAT